MLRATACAALAAVALAAPAPTLTSSVTRLSTPYAWTTVAWAGVPRPSTADWVAAFCTNGTYYWWQYASGEAAGSLDLRLFANSAGSGCASLTLSYYAGADVLMSTAPIPIDPMIQQVRLSLTSDPTQMVVDFVSSAGGSTAACAYGSSRAALTSRAPAATTHLASIGNVSHALLQGLVPGQRVFYACGDEFATSETWNFTAGGVQPGMPQRVAVFADFGVNDGFGLAQIASDAEAGLFDFSLHAGDWAYDLNTGNSANGNFFMNRAMLYSAAQPVQPACGNHEGATSFGLAFGEYQARHPGVAAHANTNTSLYYSFEVGLVHYLVFNSETYIEGGIAAMLAFMRADLAGVDRSRTPWVVAYSHKLWWMDGTDFSEISGILQSGRVDLLFAGHWHYFERYAPYDPVAKVADTAAVSADGHTYTAPAYPVMIVSGAPGDVERNDACPGDPSLRDIVLACTPQYGYGILTVHNASAVTWEFTAEPTPIGGRRRPFLAPQAGYTDYLHLVK